MARVTIEDCVDKVEDRFELVVLASERAKKISSGSKPLIEEKEQEKPTVLSLRELAAEKINAEDLREETVLSNQKIKNFLTEDYFDEAEEQEIMEETEIEIE